MISLIGPIGLMGLMGFEPFASFGEFAVVDYFPDVGARRPRGRIYSSDVVDNLLPTNHPPTHIIHLHPRILQSRPDVQHILPRIGISHRHGETSVMGFVYTKENTLRKSENGMLKFACLSIFSSSCRKLRDRTSPKANSLSWKRTNGLQYTTISPLRRLLRRLCSSFSTFFSSRLVTP